jgi:hypothetical protein
MAVTFGTLATAPTATTANIGDYRIDLALKRVYRNTDGRTWQAQGPSPDELIAALLAEPTALSSAALDDAISTQVSALVDAAPGTLDTLNELAAALGDDPNYAATITTALAGKQPLDSDLTAIAALTTTAYGRAFLALADQAALMGLVPAATESAPGKVELATAAETATGTDGTRAVTPAALAGSADARMAAVLGSGGAFDAELSATFAPRWKANTAYTAGDVVQAPDGSIVERVTSGTSGATYSVTNWKAAAGVLAKPTTDLGDWTLLRRDTSDASKGVVWTTPHATVARALGWAIATDPQYGATGNGTTDDTAAIVAALAAVSSGGKVWLGAGAFKVSSTITVPSGVALWGAGRQTTRIVTNSATAHVLVLTDAASIQGLKVHASVTRTSGFHVQISGNGCTVADCDITGYYIGINVGTIGTILAVSARIQNCNLYSPVVAAGGGGIQLRNFHNASVSECVISGPALPGTQPDYGIRVRNGDTAFITATNVTLHGAALLVDPPAGENCYGLTISDSFFDSAGTITGGASVSGGNFSPAGNVYNTQIANTWFGLSASMGCNVLPSGAGIVDGLEFTGCQFTDNTNDGLLISGAGCKNITITGGQASGNSNGVRINGAATYWSIIGLRAGNIAGRGANLYGINIPASAVDNYMIVGCNLRGNTTASLFDGGTGANKVVANNLV